MKNFGEKFPSKKEGKVEQKEQLENPVSLGNVLDLLDDVEDNFKHLKGIKKLEEKLDGLEDNLEEMDKEQREIIKEKVSAEWIGHFYFAVAVARDKKGSFFVNENGDKLFQGKYFKKVKDFDGEAYQINIDGEWYFMDKNGNRVEE